MRRERIARWMRLGAREVLTMARDSELDGLKRLYPVRKHRAPYGGTWAR